MLHKVLVANRGEIAVRILRACFDEAIPAVAGLSSVDVESLPAVLADEVLCLGPPSASDSYLSVPAVVSAALLSGCDSVHPGYGFLSERPDLAEACAANNLIFVGPTSETIRRGADKVAARELARALGIPVSSGSATVSDVEEAGRLAERAGYPVLLKAAAGGGGRGMVRVSSPAAFIESFERASHEAQQAFGDGRIYIERYVTNARHVEVQILADGHGSILHLGDRDCSCQRRYQKLIEEAPASAIESPVRTQLHEAAVAMADALGYIGAGTVEFLVDQDRDTFAFLEVNTRLQVEHPVTEMVTGVDIVREQLRIAGGARLSIRQSDVKVTGHAIECRINAESVASGFAPAPGRITQWVVPQGTHVRVDTHCYPGYVVPPNYDSLLAKLVVHGQDRREAIEVLERALRRFRVNGVDTTIDLHAVLAAHSDFQANRVTTRWVEDDVLTHWGAASMSAPAATAGGR